MKKILLVCSGNTCRSPMAQAMLQQMLHDTQNKEITVKSAGLFTSDGLPASEAARLVMEEMGLDLSGHTSQKVNEALMAEAELVLTMTEEQRQILAEAFPQKKQQIFTLVEFTGQPGRDIDDPYGMGWENYRKVSEELKEILMRLRNILIKQNNL
ncbi:MAG: low molecular weight protein arginine phosphatase [Syntrophomonadaceae bacterium]|nr:low molecular weight protein arginine phosphatase [Syntrophomonadaceae bacterium]